MSFYPALNYVETSREFTDTFAGYNHNLKIADGELYDMENLTADSFPLLSTRARRGTVKTITKPNGLSNKNQLIYVDGTKLYYNNTEVVGITLTDTPKQIISFGANVVIFPDKVYLNTANLADYGALEATFQSVLGADIEYVMSDANATEYDISYVSPSAPSEPADGQYWVDTSDSIHALKRYSASSSMWVSVPTTYVKISYPNIGVNFNIGDGITISGCSTADTEQSENDAPAVLSSQIEALNQKTTIQTKGDDYIVVIGILDRAYTQQSGQIEVKRSVPDMDYVVEAQNRLWGCKFGLVGDKVVNEIYASKLGDFKNWNVFVGNAADSYAASLGSDGVFTGAISYQGYPLFFKENFLHKVYISSTGAHQIETVTLNGVQEGSSRSLAIADNVLYYKGRTAVYAFDGSVPVEISSPLGDKKYYCAVGGAIGGKYYISMSTSPTGLLGWNMFVYSSSKRLWHREDDMQALFFAQNGDDLYCIASDNVLYALLGTNGTLETDLSWKAETGLIGYEYPDNKYLSRFNVRGKISAKGVVDVYLEYDSSGYWEHKGRMVGNNRTRSYLLPILPQRCDHLRIRIKGTGDAKLYSIAKVLEIGGDGNV